MINLGKWVGTILQLVGSLVVAANLSWSGWAFPAMLVGSVVWSVVAVVEREWSLALMEVAFSGANMIGVFRWLL